ncbi:MAG: hypothetical protein ACU0FH_02190 [Heliomarina sp.]|uniref:hypothetical protein n=1 Tax=Heliomarina sp. TaxID=2917556 RepID=UPI0040582C25
MIEGLIAQVLPWILTILGGIAAALVYGRRERRKGRVEERQKAKEQDHEKATAIRDRVDRDLPDRVREYDGAGYRD